MEKCYCSNRDLFNFGCRCKGRPKFYVWTNLDLDEWWIGESAEDVAEMARVNGYVAGDGAEAEDWSRVPDEKMIFILDEEGKRVAKRAKEWAATEPKGFLCGKDF